MKKTTVNLSEKEIAALIYSLNKINYRTNISVLGVNAVDLQSKLEKKLSELKKPCSICKSSLHLDDDCPENYTEHGGPW